MYSVKLRRVHATILAVEKQRVSVSSYAARKRMRRILLSLACPLSNIFNTVS